MMKKNKMGLEIAGGAIINKYRVFVELKDIGGYNNFGKAFGALHAGVKNLLAKGTSWQVLETACWIDCSGFKMYFYEARDIAYCFHIMDDGKIIKTETSTQEEKLISVVSRL